MKYNIVFYLSAFFFLYHSITGNVAMMDMSFKALVIFGFLNTFHLLDGFNRR